jgi:hypothetical protein
MTITDADALKVNWYAEKTNRDEPIWEFKCFGHHGEVVYGGDKTLWSAKLDNSGRYGYLSADEAKSVVEQWLRAKIARNIETAKEYFAQYADLITNAPTVEREGWVSLTDMQITNIAMQHQSLHQVAKAIDNELRAINNV